MFSVARSGLGPEGAKILAEMLRVSSSMTSLNLASNNLTQGPLMADYSSDRTDMTGIKAIADALSVSTSMTSLK